MRDQILHAQVGVYATGEIGQPNECQMVSSTRSLLISYLLNTFFHDVTEYFNCFLLTEPDNAPDGLVLDRRVPLGLYDVYNVGSLHLIQTKFVSVKHGYDSE